MSDKKTYIVELNNSDQEAVIKSIDEAIKENYNYIFLIINKNFTSALDKLIKKVRRSPIPIVLYTTKTCDHSEGTNRLMESVPYVITGIENITNLAKMIPDLLDNEESNRGD